MSSIIIGKMKEKCWNQGKLYLTWRDDSDRSTKIVVNEGIIRIIELNINLVVGPARGSQARTTLI